MAKFMTKGQSQMNVAYITPHVAKWARERADMSVEQLAGAMKIDSRTVAAWEQGHQVPPFRKAEKLADQLRIPFGYLFLSKPPKGDIPLPDLRTVGNIAVSKPSLNFVDVVNDALLKQQWYGEYLEESGAQKVAFVGSCRVADGVQGVSRHVTTALGIDRNTRAKAQSWQQFLSYIVQRAEDLGILVMQRGIVGNNTKRTLNVEEFRGFAIADKYAPLVFINARDAKAAKNFTLVHELCHLWVGQSGISNPQLKKRIADETNAVEKFCNKVAAEVLAPREELIRLWAMARGTDENIAELARYFRVSRYVVARQASETNRISYDQYLDYLDRNPWFSKAATSEAGETTGSFYNTFGARNGKRLISGVLGALGQSKITFRDASALLGIRIATLKKVAERFG
jgi:Zn-dependent peptidase ImmA (M78 family)/transcriptional regulator with XRE-family HTH domain